MQPYEQLETDFGKFTNQPNMVACSSGTAAMHLAFEALRATNSWYEGDKVLVPDYTMAACARAVILAGLEPVFVDCGDDLLMDEAIVNDVDWRIAGIGQWNPTAVMLVHIYGRQCRLPRSVVDRPNVAVVEDLAEAHGIKPYSRTDTCCWSFYMNKIIAGEEGGAVSFQHDWNATKAKCLRSLGFGPEQDYWHEPRGHNYRLANCLASKVLDSLERYSKNKIERDLLWKAYDAQSFGPRYHPRGEPEAKWVYDLRIKDMTWEEQDRLIAALKAEGIAARHGFKPLHMQKEFKKCQYFGSGNSVKCSKETIYLPLRPGFVTQQQIEKSAEIVRKMTA